MTSILSEFKYKINFICKSMVKPFPFHKIYIDEKNTTHLNLLCIPFEYIKDNSRFINNNVDILQKIIEYKNECNLQNLYIEMDFNLVKIIECPCASLIGKDYFLFLENHSLLKKILLNKIELDEDDIVREVVLLIQLFDCKKALQVIQYILCEDIFCNLIVKKVFDRYIELLDKENNFYRFNNFRYVRELVLHKLSLESLNVELSC